MSELNESQRRIAETLDGMIVVDAGPGTGKTETIVARYVNVVSQEGVDPRDVLMLTFTNNAAEEMERRIKGRMAESDALRDKAKLVRASTFDSFCLSVVMDSPEQAGEAFGLKERITRGASIVQNDTLNREWFREFLDDFLVRKGDDYGEWAAIGSTCPADILGLINRLMARGLYPYRKGWFGLDPERQLLGDMDRVYEDIVSGARGSADKILKKASSRKELSPMPLEDDVLPDDAIHDAAYDPREGLLAFIHDVYFEYVDRSLASDRLTFGITAMLAFGLLYDDAGVRERNSYRYVMIDEFQDTNASQLMTALMILKRPNLCVVGDWKQGIYGFRFVSIDNIIDFEKRAVALRRFLNDDVTRIPFSIPEVRKLALEINYRSSGTVIDGAFRSMYLRGSGKDVVDRERLDRDVKPISPGRTDIGEDTEMRFVKTAGRPGQLDAVARCVRDYVGSGRYTVHDNGSSRPLGFGDIAVLCRTTRGCADVLEALSRRGIPAYLQGDLELMSTKEGKLALAWLRFVNNVRDPWGYVPIMAHMGYTMVQISEARRVKNMPMELLLMRKDVYKNRRRITKMLAMLFSFHPDLDQDNVQAVISVLSSTHRGSLLTVSDLVRMMEEDIEEETRYPVENSVDVGAVRIMTMHKAKGLQFQAVIVPFLDQSSMPLTPKDNDVFTFSERNGVRCTKVVHDYDGYRKLVDSWETALVKGSAPVDYDEERRLMFVALSRAKQYETLICGPKASQFMIELSKESYTEIPDAELPPVGVESSPSNRPDVSGYTTRPKRYGVHEMMKFPEDGMGGMSESGDEVPGKGMEYGTRVHEAAQLYFETGKQSTFPEFDRVKEIVDRAKGIEGSMVEVDCILPVKDESLGVDVILRGRIDLIINDGGRIEIHDYKTDASRKFKGEYEFQLSIYAQAAMAFYKTKDVRCHLDFVSLNPEPGDEFSPWPMEDIARKVRERLDSMADKTV